MTRRWNVGRPKSRKTLDHFPSRQTPLVPEAQPWTRQAQPTRPSPWQLAKRAGASSSDFDDLGSLQPAMHTKAFRPCKRLWPHGIHVTSTLNSPPGRTMSALTGMDIVPFPHQPLSNAACRQHQRVLVNASIETAENQRWTVSSAGNVFSKSKCRWPSNLGNSSSPSNAKVSRNTTPLTPKLMGTRTSYQSVGKKSRSHRSSKKPLEPNGSSVNVLRCTAAVERSRATRRSSTPLPRSKRHTLGHGLIVHPGGARDVMRRDEIAVHQGLVKLHGVQVQTKIRGDGVAEIQRSLRPFHVDHRLWQRHGVQKSTTPVVPSVNVPK